MMKRRGIGKSSGPFALALLMAAAPPDAPVADAANARGRRSGPHPDQEGRGRERGQGDGMTALPLGRAIKGTSSMAQLLVTAGGSLESVTRRGLVHAAARGGEGRAGGAAVKALLDGGADRQLAERDGHHRAARERREPAPGGRERAPGQGRRGGRAGSQVGADAARLRGRRTTAPT
jgi:hypothetical protein